MCELIVFKILYHQSSDLTHTPMNVCNIIPTNILGLVLELTFSCSSQQQKKVGGK